MKKRNLTTLTIVALLLAVLTLIAVSGTYAKYTTTITGKAKAIIAKWDFKASETSVGSLTDTFTINLADTATVGQVTVGVGEDAVNKIQPGSEGDIIITIDNTASEVAASLTVTAEAAANGVLDATQFTFDDAVITVGGQEADSVPAGGTGEAKVHWTWVYSSSETYDAKDTTVGNGAGAEIDLINLVVTGFQAQPTV